MAVDQTASVFQDADQATKPTEEVLPVLVGEGKKYKTVDELAKAYINADGFIEKLKQENAELRAKADQATTLEEVMKQLKQPTPSPEDNPDKGGPTLSEGEIATIVRKELTGLETVRTKEANLLKADALMKQAFGEKAVEVFQKNANTPQVKKALMELASVSPEAFLAVFVKPQSGDQTSTDSNTSVNSGAITASTSGRVNDPETKEYYDTLRKKEPAKYYSQAVQLQMQRAAINNRAKFFGTT